MSSVARAVSPQTTSKSPLPSSPPKSIKEANIMVVEAWKVTFPSLRFPSKLIGMFPQAATKGIRDIQLGNGVVIHDVPAKYDFVVDLDLAHYRKE
jgi:hypothetical protein